MRCVISDTASELNEELVGSAALHRLYSARSSMNRVISIDVNLDSTIGTVTRT